jgi:SAM-dependent methyltransferase
MGEVDPARRWCFDRDPDAYARWRPGYPDRLYAILERVCGLGLETAVLEIGPGTGQATRELLAQRLRAELPENYLIALYLAHRTLPA